MLGAIVGDTIGSVYEFNNIKTKDFPLFTPYSQCTDDSILTIATADVILYGGNYAERYKEYFNRYPEGGYGGRFSQWAISSSLEPYNSWGNGSAMRVSPVGFAFNELDAVLAEAKRSAEVTHNHPEGIKGAQATAAAIFLARKGRSKNFIKAFIEKEFGYNLNQTLAEIRPNYQFNESCQGTVPQAIVAFLESTDFEDAIRNAISLGGDSDTLACITGSIAEAFYGSVPKSIAEEVLARLTDGLREITLEFISQYGTAN